MCNCATGVMFDSSRNKQWLEELRRFRTEADEVLGIKEKQK
jgi:hypothetical protein